MPWTKSIPDPPTKCGDASSWLNLQQTYDLKNTEAKVAKLIAKQIQPLEHA
ncbi:MAG TPA: hypothetical protein VNS29_07075 [Burkholderiaceae bacterium]|nr:hypothetical protein [Burkholderiaceae bacterium]